jgi:hypothetical protein
MVAVNIGDVSYFATLRSIPKSQWNQAMREKRYFVQREFKGDCLTIVDFVEDAVDFFAEAGYASPEDFLLQGLGLNPTWAFQAAEFIKTHNIDYPLPVDKLNRLLAERGAQKDNQNAAKPERTALIHQLRSQGLTQQAIADELGISQQAVAKHLKADTTNEPNNIRFECCTTPTPTAPRSYGTSKEYNDARVARDYPEELDNIGLGKKYRSSRALLIAKGDIKPKSAFRIEDPSSYAEAALKNFTQAQIVEIAEYLLNNLDEAQPDDPEPLPEPVAEVEPIVEPEPPALEDVVTPKPKAGKGKRYSLEERAAMLAAVDSGRKKLDVAREWGIDISNFCRLLKKCRQTG